MKVTGLVLWVQENRISEKFYKKLGFEVITSDEEHSVIGLDGFELTLVNMRDDQKFEKDSMSSAKGRGMYIYISVDDVNQTYKDLVSQGFKPATKPKDWEWGNREFILKDPDEYKLCFWQKI